MRLLVPVLLLLVSAVSDASALTDPRDPVLTRVRGLLRSEQHQQALTLLEGADPSGYDLGDYLLHFRAEALLGKGDFTGAERAAAELGKRFPASPLVGLTAHKISFQAARKSDLALARRHRVEAMDEHRDPGRRAEGRYVAARLQEGTDPAAAAEAHLANAHQQPGMEGALLSSALIWEWRQKGNFARWGLPLSFHQRYAQVLVKEGEYTRAWAIYSEAAGKFFGAPGYAELILEFADNLRRQGFLSRAAATLEKLGKNLPPQHREERELLLGRIDWRAGRLEEARGRFLKVATGSADRGRSQRARHQSALLAESLGKHQEAAAAFALLTEAQDAEVRQEATFRLGLSLYQQRRYREAVEAFGHAGPPAPADESARRLFWRARSLVRDGRGEEGRSLLAGLAADPLAGVYAFLSLEDLGQDPFSVFVLPDKDPVPACLSRSELWAAVKRAAWEPDEVRTLGRVERLAALGLGEFAFLEAGNLRDATISRDLGLPQGTSTGVFRFLAGDVRGAIRAVIGLPPGGGSGEVVDKLLYPLLPDLLPPPGAGSGVDPLVVHSIIRQESLFQHDALSRAGAVGLMQLMPATATETARLMGLTSYRRQDLLAPATNVALGSSHFARLLRRYQGDYFRSVAAYNAGERPVKTWWEEAGGDHALFAEKIAYAETRGYLRKVFANLVNYHRIYCQEAYRRCFLAPANRRAGRG
jgi:TolA-binding protein